MQVSGSKVAASLRDLRYVGVVQQTTDYSCGAAAVACLLQVYCGIPATESEVLELAEHQMISRGEEPGVERGLTAYDLKTASSALGLNMAGYELTYSQLQDYFERGGMPLIAHVTKPQSHYLVVVGIVADRVLLADPSWGRYIAPACEFVDARGMSGVFLVPILSVDQASRARRTQKSALEWMQARLLQLTDLREAIL